MGVIFITNLDMDQNLCDSKCYVASIKENIVVSMHQFCIDCYIEKN